MFILNSKRCRLLKKIGGSEITFSFLIWLRLSSVFRLMGLCLAAMFLNLRVYAQTLTELQKELEKTPSDTAKILLKASFARRLIYDNRLKEGFDILEKTKIEAEKLNYKKGKAMVCGSMAAYYFYSKKFKEAEEFAKNAIKQFIEIGDYARAAIEYVWLGYTYGNQHKYSETKNCHLKAIEFARKGGSKAYEAKAMIALGEMYYQMGNYEECKKYTTQALDFSKRYQLKQYIANSYWNLGNVALDTKDAKNCQAYFLKSHQIYKEVGDEHNAYAALGVALEMYRELGNPAKAYKGFFEIYEWQKSKNDLWGMLSSCDRIGQMYIDLKKYDLAEEYLLKATEIAQKFNSQYLIIDINSRLSKLYFIRGDIKKGEAVQNKTKALRDSLYTSDQNKALAEFDVKYKTADRERQLAESQLDITQKRNWIVGLLLAFVSLLGFGIFYWRIREVKQKNVLQDTEIEKQKEILKAREIERQRIAKELHDSVGSQLTVVSTSLDNAFFLAEKQRLIPQKLESINNEVRFAAQSLRDTIWATHNSTILVSNLYARMQQYLSKIAENDDDLQINSSRIGDDYELNSIQALNIFRIFQEGIQNIQKHANASQIKLFLTTEDQKLILKISDNGIGFDKDKVIINENFGLSNMKNRSDEINAELIIDSKPNAGTNIEIILALI